MELKIAPGSQGHSAGVPCVNGTAPVFEQATFRSNTKADDASGTHSASSRSPSGRGGNTRGNGADVGGSSARFFLVPFVPST